MGRHSAPDRGTEFEATGVAGGPDAAPSAAPDAATGPGSTAPAAETAPAPDAGSGLRPGSRGDLQLLRTQPRLRAGCAGVVVLSFAIYTAVLLGLGRWDLYPIWLWVPIVVSGVLVGALLDRAHRSLDRAR